MANRGPYAKSAAVRERILTTALEVIADQGFSGATLQQVAEGVGMSKAGVLHHVGSREQLFADVLRRRDALVEGVGVEGLIGVVRHNASVPGLVALFCALVGDAAASGAGAAREFAQERYARLVPLLADRVAEHPDWRGDAADALVASRVLVAAADGLQTQWLLDADVDMAAHLERLWAVLTASSGDCAGPQSPAPGRSGPVTLGS